MVVSYSLCEVKYLGVHLLCGKKLRLSLHEYKAKFFRALNDILYHVKGFSNDTVIMHLIQSYCKPLLLYACECFNMTGVRFHSYVKHGDVFIGRC